MKLHTGLLRQLHQHRESSSSSHPEREDRNRSFALAFRMQSAAPDAIGLSRETPSTERLYGWDDPDNENFRRASLQARRLAEQDLRFIQVSHAHKLPFNNERWDQHSHLVGKKLP